MKNFVLVFMIFLSFSSQGQSKKDKKFQKKLDLKVINRGIDFSETFVVENNFNCQACSNVEDNWRTALFEEGLSVGNWYIENDERIYNGRYVVQISRNSVTILDANEGFNTVATLRFKGFGLLHIFNTGDNPEKRNFLIRSLKKFNP